MDEQLRFEIVGLPDSSLRIIVDQGQEEPPYMRSLVSFRASEEGGQEWRSTEAAILASDPDGDKLGLRWATRKAAEKALKAARAAVKRHG